MRLELQRVRKINNLTQKNVADYLRITNGMYQKIEYGTRGTSEDNWIRLFEYFGGNIPLQELMKNTAERAGTQRR